MPILYTLIIQNSHTVVLNWFFFNCQVNSQPQCLRREKNKVLGLLFWFSRDHKTKLVINHRVRESERESNREKKNKVFVSQAELICRAEVCRFGAQSTPLLQLKPLEIFSQGGHALCERFSAAKRPSPVCEASEISRCGIWPGQKGQLQPRTPPSPLPIPSSFFSRSELQQRLTVGELITNPPCSNNICSTKAFLKSFQLVLI